MPDCKIPDACDHGTLKRGITSQGANKGRPYAACPLEREHPDRKTCPWSFVWMDKPVEEQTEKNKNPSSYSGAKRARSGDSSSSSSSSDAGAGGAGVLSELIKVNAALDQILHLLNYRHLKDSTATGASDKEKTA